MTRRAWLVVIVVGCFGCEASSGSKTPRDAGDAAAADAGDAGEPDSGEPDAGRDAGVDASGCAEGLTRCGGGCVDTATSLAHCGGCDSPCSAPDHARAICEESSCDFVCHAGFVVEGDGCVAAPRPIRPPSLSAVTGLRPLLRWTLQEGATDAVVELCEDPACETVITTLEVTGEEATPDVDLPAGLVWWRVTANERTGPTWSFRVRSHTLEVDRAWGVRPDFDGNGLGDAVVGAPRVDDMEGRVYAYLADAEGTPSSPTTILPSPDGPGGELGRGMTTAGDVDGDGRADLLVGAPTAGEGGRAHLYLGRPDGLGTSPDVSIDAPEGASLFGGSMAGVGDVNGDGYGDVVIGAIGEGVTPGRAYLYFGLPSGLETMPSWAATGTGRFASSVAGAGDANGDGYADVAVGALAAEMMAGEVHVFFGSEGGLASEADQVLAGPDGTGGQFGFAVAGAGDVNADGFADLVASAPAAETSKGHVHAFYGSATGYADVPDVTLEGRNSGGGFFGHSLAGAGDLDGDGVDDVIVGAFGVDDRTGRVVVHRGDDGGLLTSPATTVDGPFGSDGDFGWAIAGLGDVDGGGLADILVGAPRVDSGKGRAYVYRGTAIDGITPTPLVSLVGPSGGAFGRAVARPDR